MRTLYLNLRLIFSGDTVLLVFSILTFLASLANATQWPVLHGFRFCGICVTLASVAFAAFSSIDAFKSERRKRTIIAAILFVAAALLCFSQTHIVIERGN